MRLFTAHPRRAMWKNSLVLMVLGFFQLVLDDDYLDSGLIEYGKPCQSTRSYNVPKQTTNLIWYPLGLSLRISLLVNQPVAVLTGSISPTNQFHEIQYGKETWQWKISNLMIFPFQMPIEFRDFRAMFDDTGSDPFRWITWSSASTWVPSISAIP